jgi:ABC-type branched-subunit amino acid transport system substrate-binding protein
LSPLQDIGTVRTDISASPSKESELMRKYLRRHRSRLRRVRVAACRARRLALTAGLAVLLVAGCGTTVSGVSTGRQPIAGTSGVVGASSAAAAGQGQSGLSAPGTGSSLAGSSTSRAAGAGAGGANSGSVTGGLPAGSQGVGVTASSIFVGIPYKENGDAANKALGAGAITTGDEKADAQAVIDDINARGGVAGRKLVPVFHAYDAQSTDTYADQDQAACADFTQDHHVFAVAGLGDTDTFFNCMNNAGSMIIDSGPIIYPDLATFARYPYYFELSTLSQERMMADEVNALQRQRYFSGWDFNLAQPGPGKAKLGVLSVDTPQWNRPLQHVLLPALAAAGYAVNPADVVRVHDPASTAEDGQTVTDVQSAVLKFRQDNVSHVVILDANGSVMLLFAGAARGQSYYPRLGVNSATGMQALYDAGVVQSKQLSGAVGLGWLPTIDLSAQAGDRYANSSTKHCLQVIEKRTGQTFTSTNAAGAALSYCDRLYLLADAVNAAGSVIDRDTVRATIQAMGSRFVPAGAPSAFFSPSRHDAIETGFDMKWDSVCACTKYAGSHRIP